MENIESQKTTLSPLAYLGAAIVTILIIAAVGAFWLWRAANGRYSILTPSAMILAGVSLTMVSKEKPVQVGLFAFMTTLIGILLFDALETMVILQITTLDLGDYLSITFMKLSNDPFRIFAYVVTPPFSYLMAVYGNYGVKG